MTMERKPSLRSVPNRAWLLLAVLFILSIITKALQASGVVSASSLRFFVWPVLTIFIAVVAKQLTAGMSDRIRNKKARLSLILGAMAGWLVVYFLSGMIVAYVRNSLVSDFWLSALNIVSYGITASALEYTRYRLTLLAGRKNMVRFGLVIALVFFFQQVNLQGLVGLGNLLDFIKINSVIILPPLLDSLILTFLAYACGMGSIMVYRLVDLLASLALPIIPKYDWYMIVMAVLLRTLFVFFLIDQYQQNRVATRKSYRKRRFREIIFYSLSVWLVLFMVGAFRYTPLVILSNSMQPLYSRGDMVIVQKVSENLDIRVGDIIQYQLDNRNITHRVVDTINQQGGADRMFITKGDNNPDRDADPVEMRQIFGVIRAAVPYVGLPVVWLRGAR